MDKTYELSEVILGDLIAEVLEREARLLPPEHRVHALILRRQADYFRWLHMRSLWVWREVELLEGPAAKNLHDGSASSSIC